MMIEYLDNILMGNSVVENFYDAYNNNTEFRAWLLDLLPEVEDCEKQIQRNPWHKYNVLKHILYSVEAMNTLSENLDANTRRMLAYTMFFHDIGKPKHHIERVVDGKPRDSFYNHNIGSADIAKRALPLLNFDESTCNIICKLVYKHDIFMFIKDFNFTNPHWRKLSPKLIDDEIADLNKVGNGEQLLQYLIMIGRADNLAQNEKMTPPSLRLLDKMENMLHQKINNTKKDFISI